MAFHEIAIPHKDILSQNFTSEVYAAKLWDVYKQRGSDEYKDSEIFFKKTYLTDNLKKILNSVKDRLDGKSGGHFRSIETPFGGGKTHTLIALYHMCTEWNVKPVVLVGTEIDPNSQTMWGMIEEQLTGKIEKLQGKVSHGGEALRNILETQNRPVLILIDELLQHIIKADGIKVEKSTLAKQTIGFVQELSEAVSSLPQVCVIVTLPSSANEHLDSERAAELYKQLKKFAGRTKDTIIPVSDNDIPRIIRQRLFASTDAEIRDRSESIVNDFVDYCENENIMPDGMQKSQFREAFFKSYPFLPQVIDVLYKRWGTLIEFQRTRGVLRLLSLVVNSLATSDKKFISLGDIDLNNDEIKQELISYLDPQFHSVVAMDINSPDSGASRVNQRVPDQYRGKQLGIRAATAIFMYSHSGTTGTNGATESEIKRATCSRGIPAAQISEVLNLFRDQLFYLNVANEKYLFTKEANILKIKVDVIENIKPKEIDDAKKEIIKNNIGRRSALQVIQWPTDTKDVENSHTLKLIIMKKDDIPIIESIRETMGESPRIYKNNIFVLAPSNKEEERFLDVLKNKIAWEKIRADPQITLKDEQKVRLVSELEKENESLNGLIKEYYSKLYVPDKGRYSIHNLSAPLLTDKRIDEVVYEYLVKERLINNEMGALFLKRYYLNDREYVETLNLFESMLRTPGERRPVNRDVVKKAIVDGVITGEFGIGELENGIPTCKSFKKNPIVSFESGEILVQASLCKKCDEPKLGEPREMDGDEPNRPDDEDDHGNIHGDESELNFDCTVPEGQINNISQMLLKIASHYKHLKLTIDASDGSMTSHDLDLVKETLRQIKSSSNLL